MTTYKNEITHTFDGTGESTDYLRTKVIPSVDVSISGTFSATIQVQRRRIGSGSGGWRTVEEYTDEVEKVINSAGPDWEYRFYCSAYTSGDPLCEMFAGAQGGRA